MVAQCEAHQSYTTANSWFETPGVEQFINPADWLEHVSLYDPERGCLVNGDEWPEDSTLGLVDMPRFHADEARESAFLGTTLLPSPSISANSTATMNNQCYNNSNLNASHLQPIMPPNQQQGRGPPQPAFQPLMTSSANEWGTSPSHGSTVSAVIQCNQFVTTNVIQQGPSREPPKNPMTTPSPSIDHPRHKVVYEQHPAPARELFTFEAARVRLVERDQDDLYSPSMVRGKGYVKEGKCPLCPTDVWLKIKQSAYWYHMNFCHGISAMTGKRHSLPIQYRIQREHAEGSCSIEGLCQECKKWVTVLVKDYDWSLPQEGIESVNHSAWYKHAQKCGSTLGKRSTRR